MSRREELAANLAAVQERIAAACAAAGRPAAELSLVAVTKTWPATDIRLLAELGVTDVGENKDQEARTKHADLVGLPLRWHFVGQLQRNKCRSIARYADVVHSVDRLPVLAALSAGAQEAGRTLTLLVQVDLAEASSPGRGGAPAGDVPSLCDAVAAADGIRLGGLMAVAPLGVDPDRAFARLADLSGLVRERHPGAVTVSAGMSGDLEAAVRHGATHLRIGTALLGHRAQAVG